MVASSTSEAAALWSCAATVMCVAARTMQVMSARNFVPIAIGHTSCVREVSHFSITQAPSAVATVTMKRSAFADWMSTKDGQIRDRVVVVARSFKAMADGSGLESKCDDSIQQKGEQPWRLMNASNAE